MKGAQLAGFLHHGESRRIHLIGVAGSGMSGLAGLLLALGHRVSGSDRVSSREVERLQKLGLDFHTPHRAGPVEDAELVIFSSAIRTGNVAFDTALQLGKPMIRRAEALAGIMVGKRGIVVAGMHGKTTTSAMTAHFLRQAGLHPSHYVGAEIPLLRSNAHWDPEGEWFVAEGDESDGTLRLFTPEHAILLNVEEEHLDFYEDLEAIRVVFRSFLAQTTGVVLYCRDDEEGSGLGGASSKSRSYGFHPEADYRIVDDAAHGTLSTFRIEHQGEVWGPFELPVPGRHNVSNAAAGIAMASLLGAEMPKLRRAVKTFRGARRRFEVRYHDADFDVVDDYAHHPTELEATLQSAAQLQRKRRVVLFQPHRFSRTQALKNEFARVLAGADLVVVTGIYPASEPPIKGVTGAMVVDAMRGFGNAEAWYEESLVRARRFLGSKLTPGDLILSLGAGNVHEAGTELARDLEVRRTLLQVIKGKGKVKLYEPLSSHTTLRVGGPARYWCEPEDETALAALLKHCRVTRLPLFLLGRGSNLLVRDGGLEGLVISLSGTGFQEMRVEGNTIMAGVGVRMKRLAGAARKAGLAGFEWMEGIPGNVGGALRMNAGAMGSEMFDQVRSVRCAGLDGRIRELKPEKLGVGYRSVSGLKNRCAVGVVLEGRPDSPEAIAGRMEEMKAKRKSSQPSGASAGCIFKNPKDDSAGRMIEELGLKGRNRGAARVSRVHGNFIVNEGGATAAEVLGLIEEVRAEVRRRKNVELETEVEIVGEDE